MKRILIIDDEQDITELVEMTLESHGGFKCRQENDAGKAIETAREFQPDLIILDIMMPNIDGSELASKFLMHRDLADIPIIFLTALVTSQEIHNGSFVRGTRIYLPKPINAEELLDCINKTLEAPFRPVTVAS